MAAQSPPQLLQQGIRAYRELEFDAAAGFLRQSLSGPVGSLAPSDRAEAFTYLGASEVFRGNIDSAEVAFRDLVLLDARYQPDRLVFPPEVTNVFDRIRRDTKVVTIGAPGRTQIRWGTEEYGFLLFASSFHRVRAAILSGDGEERQLLYRGPVVDSIEVRWDGSDVGGRYAESGSYWIAVASIDTSGSPVRTVRVPLVIRANVRDTLLHPEPPADSLFLPESNPSGPGVEALLGGLLIGGALTILPGALASDADLGATSYLVGGAVSLAGVVGFFTHRPGRQIPANIEANSALRRGWQERAEEVARENAARRGDVRLVIESGTPSIVEHGRLDK
jgi:hypothetical protein